MIKVLSMAAYYGMKIIKELGLPLSKKIRFVVGSDEESGWGDMDYYSSMKKNLILVSLPMRNSQSSMAKKGM